jgi:hypothetical protein
MLFGRLRVPLERALAPEPRDRYESGFHVLADLAGARGEPPQPLLSLVPAPLGADDEFAGLDRLDREELDELDED